MGGVEGEAPGTAIGGGMWREDTQDFYARLCLVDEYVMCQMAAGHKKPASV